MQPAVFTESLASRIPRAQGLYAFYLDLVSPGKLGLNGRGPWSRQQLERAKDVLLLRVKKQIALLRSVRLSGEVRELEKRDHLALRVKILGEETWATSLLEELQALPVTLVKDYAGLLRQSAIMIQPVYVGITKEQSLYERYRQHRRDHLVSTDQSKFGVRLRNAGIDWDDLVFACIPFYRGQDQFQLLATLERHFQLLARPVLSVG